MCGIAGIVWRGQVVEQALLRPVAERLRHRGPDGEGYFTQGPFGLVHTRLSIIDLSGGHQPLVADDGRTALVANGEIYNYLELQAELQAAGRVFATQSDSETILHAYALDPSGFIDRLHGMFSFALFDGHRQRLVLARDRLGIKPLFYAQLPDRFVFASELKALLPLLPHAPAIEPVALSQFLHHQFSTGTATILSGIRRACPGEIIEIDADLVVSRRRYWSPLAVAPRDVDAATAEEEFDALFGQVMTEHIRSDVPYGLFLSGGNDSAILLAALSRLQTQPVRTFSIGYTDVDMADELDDAERMAALFGSRHTSFRLDRSAVFRRIPHTVWAADELMRDYASLPTSALSEAAGHELKVVFSGEGGDEVFGGYGRYRQHPLLLFFKKLVAPGSGGFRTSSQWGSRWRRRLLGPTLAAHRGSVRAPFIASWGETPADWTHLQRCQYTDLVTALPDNLLVKADRMMMAFALEGRVPFLDHRLVEFGLALPDHLKADGSQTKILLRRWARRHIPEDHLYRRKRGFHVPVDEWLSGTFLDHLEQKLTGNAALGEWFRTERFPELFHTQRTRRGASREIFSLLQFAIWHRLFIEEPGARPSP
ncbi:MAG: asparagine synthase (glutamine-hydrolyzing), partial [Gammaproteobacteria bacterium]|nr:asparagine synthase (glutamine-hydrolyzing) [Gammaproteobacteria bacterium]